MCTYVILFAYVKWNVLFGTMLNLFCCSVYIRHILKIYGLKSNMQETQALKHNNMFFPIKNMLDILPGDLYRAMSLGLQSIFWMLIVYFIRCLCCSAPQFTVLYATLEEWGRQYRGLTKVYHRKKGNQYDCTTLVLYRLVSFTMQ